MNQIKLNQAQIENTNRINQIQYKAVFLQEGLCNKEKQKQRHNQKGKMGVIQIATLLKLDSQKWPHCTVLIHLVSTSSEKNNQSVPLHSLTKLHCDPRRNCANNQATPTTRLFNSFGMSIGNNRIFIFFFFYKYFFIIE